MPLSGGGLLRILNAEFGPLWFVKYLMIFSLISPVTYYLFRKKYLGACSVFVMLVMNAIFYHFGIMRIPINVNANNIAMINYQYIFFGMGAYGALNFRKVVETPSWKKTFVAGIVWLALIASYGIFSMEKSNALTSHLFRLVYAVALWFALDFVKVFKIQCWMKNSFFLYCSHLMLLQCLQRVCEIIIGKVRLFQATLYVLEYMFLPVVVVIVLMSLAEFMKKRIPKTYKVLTGNRG